MAASTAIIPQLREPPGKTYGHFFGHGMSYMMGMKRKGKLKLVLDPVLPEHAAVAAVRL